jgi:hypothetical protein
MLINLRPCPPPDLYELHGLTPAALATKIGDPHYYERNDDGKAQLDPLLGYHPPAAPVEIVPE